MKNLFAMLTIIVAFVSCSDKVGDWRLAAELRTAHDLMQEQPDSALRFLISFDLNEKADIAEMNEYQILIAEALYKNDYQQTNDAAVIAAAAYFDSILEIYPENKNLAFETARAHYYKAVGETEKDDIVAACEDYLEAADIMEKEFPEIGGNTEKEMTADDSRQKTKFAGLIYERIGQLMLSESCCELAVENFKESLIYTRLSGNKRATANILKHIGYSYHLAEEPDSAVSYYRKALAEGKEYDNIREEIIVGIATLYNDNGKSDSAKIMLRDNLSSNNLNVKAQSSLTTGEIFNKECEYDSASYYYSISFEIGNGLTKVASARRLSEIYEKKGDVDRAAYFSRFVAGNAINEINRSVKTKELVVSYNNHKEKENRSKTIRMIVLYSVIVVIVVGIIFAVRSILYHVQRARLSAEILASKRLIDDVNWRLSITNGKLESARRKIYEQQDAIKNKDDEIDSIRQSITDPDTDECLDKFRTSNICASIMSNINKCDAKGIKHTELEPLTASELSELRRAADANLNKFTSRIMKKFPQLNGDDVTYMCLYLLDISDNAISGLMDKNVNTVWYRAKKLRTILGISPKESIHNTLCMYI